MKSVKIFISSTFRDMNAERDVLIKRVFPLLREKAETELGVQVREIDLRWGVTEEQAKRGEVEGLCLDGIEECKPYFLSMIGARYGWIPAPAWVRKAKLDAILNGNALNQEEKDFLRRVYNLADVDARVYTLDVGITNEEKDRAQQLLAKGGLAEAGISITEKEIRHALDNTELPRFIPELERRINEHAGMPDEQKNLLRNFYVRSGGEPVWHLQPGATDTEIAELHKALDAIVYSRDYHRFFFIRNDSADGFYRMDDNGDIDTTYVDTEPSQQQKLRALKQRISDSKASETCDEYPCTWNAENIGKEESSEYPVTGLDAFEQKVFNALWSHMQQNPELKAEQELYKTDNWGSLEQHDRNRIKELYYEHLQQLKFIDSRTYNFRGREKLLDTIEQSVARALQTKDSGYVMVVGEPGSGKSALLARVYNRINESGISGNKSAIVLIPGFIGASSRSTNPLYLLRDCCFILKDAFGLDDEVPDDPNKLKTAFTDISGKTDRPVVIILDAINQLQKTENARRMRWLPDKLPENVCVLTSVVEDTRGKAAKYDIEQDTTALDAMRNRRPAPAEIQVGKLTKKEKRDIIASYLRQYNKRLSGQQLKTIATKRESYNPLYVQCALEELRIVSRHEELDNFINELPPTTVKVFRSILDRVEHDLAQRFSSAESDFFRKFMVYMATGRNGMTEQDLRLLLGDWQNVKEQGEEQTRISEFHWGELRRCLRPYLFQRGEQWDFFHQQLKQAVGEKYLEKVKSRIEAHKSIADYLEVMGYEHLTTVKDLPHHLTKAAMSKPAHHSEWDRLIGIMCDIIFISARAKASLLHEMQADYAELLSLVPEGDTRHCIQDYQSIFVMKKHLLRQYAHLSFQTLYNELQWRKHKTKHYAENSRKRFIQKGGQFLHQYRPPVIAKSHLIMTLSGHSWHVNSASFSPAGDLIASAGHDNTVRTWNATTGTEIKRFMGHGDEVNCCAFSPDGTKILSASDDNTLKIWDVETGEALRSLIGHSGKVQCCAFSPDGTKILSADDDGNLKVWHVHTGSQLSSFAGHYRRVKCCAFSPDGKWILSAGDDHVLKLWEVHTCEQLASLRGHTAAVNSCMFSPDGRMIMSAGSDKTLRFWDVHTRKELVPYTFNNNSAAHIECCAFSPAGERIVFARGEILSVWDARTRKELVSFPTHREGALTCGFSPDGTVIVTAGWDGDLKLWDACDTREQASLMGHGNIRYIRHVQSCSFSRNGKKVVTASADRTLKTWDAHTGKELVTFSGHKDVVDFCAFSPDGKRIASASRDKTLRIWDADTGREIMVLGKGYNEMTSCAFSPDGREIISTDETGILTVWDAENGTELQTLAREFASVSACSLSPDGRRAVFADCDETLRIRDIATGQERASFAGYNSSSVVCSCCPDGKRITSADGECEDCDIRVWDADTGREEASLSGHQRPVNACVFSSDGRSIVSASDDRTVRIWEVDSGKEIISFLTEAQALSCCVSPNGSLILCGDSAGNVYFLRLEGFVTGIPVLTAARLWLFTDRKRLFRKCYRKGNWADATTVDCPWCGKRFKVSFEDKGKVTECPDCSGKAKITRGIVDNRGITIYDGIHRNMARVSDNAGTHEDGNNNNERNARRTKPWWRFWKK